MPLVRKRALSQTFDLPLILAAVLTAVFYWVITRESMRDTLLHRYTTEHIVEYVIVAFFMWGVMDALCRALTFPRELLALREDWLPPRTERVAASQAAALLQGLRAKPEWMRESRLGQRLTRALTYVAERGSADEFHEYLQDLSIQDDEATHRGYGLIRFIVWVTPVLGFLGTVLHFGTALSGFSIDEIASQLHVVLKEMGAAFNTTTGALATATTMMFALFLCERTERGIVHSVDRRTEAELLNRFQVTDASLTPFLTALESAGHTTLRTMDASVERQLAIWSNAFELLQQQSEERERRQVQLWQAALEKLEGRFEVSDADREKRLRALLDSLHTRRDENQRQVQATVDQVAGLREEFSQLVNALGGIFRDKGNLVELQSTLANNLRLLRETQQIDQALHGLAAAIHLLTARQQPAATKDQRAA